MLRCNPRKMNEHFYVSQSILCGGCVRNADSNSYGHLPWCRGSIRAAILDPTSHGLTDIVRRVEDERVELGPVRRFSGLLSEISFLVPLEFRIHHYTVRLFRW